MGRPCDCGCSGPYNLMKLNPATGAVLWKTFVPAAGTSPNSQSLIRCEALHGTNDIIVATFGDYSLNFAAGIARVDSTGSQQWFTQVGGMASVPPSATRRIFDVDTAGRIICLNANAGTPNATQALDQFGSVLWTRSSFVPTSIRSGTDFSYVSIGVGVGTYAIKKIANSSGTDLWASTSVFSSPTVRAINYIDNSFLDTDSTSRLRDNTGTPLATLSWAPESTRFGPNGYSDAETSSQRARAADSSGNTQWQLTGIGGALFGGALLDCCTDGAYGYGSIGYYFAGAQLTGTGGTKFNIFKTDVGGNLLWTQQYGTSPSSTTVSGLCLSDDGYLYAAGGYNPS